MKKHEPHEISVGCWVRLRDADIGEETIHLVEESAEKPEAGRISPKSPFAQAIIGAKPGETVRYETRDGAEEVEILAMGLD